MPELLDEKVKEFLSLFHGDIIAAQKALKRYGQKVRDVSIAQTRGHAHAEAIITVENVSKRYRLGRQTINALQEVNLSIGRGEFIAITGASGSGKSTLLQIIGCLDKPTSGAVIINTKDVTKLNDSQLSELRKETIGFIFQSFYLQPFLKLGDNVTVPAMFTNKNKSDIDAKVAQLLQQVGLSERIDHFPKELSGGQIQRAAIARALMNNPHIVLADEPTGNLDSANSNAIIELFRTIRDTLGTTIIIVTHDADIARQADRVIELKDGAIV